MRRLFILLLAVLLSAPVLAQNTTAPAPPPEQSPVSLENLKAGLKALESQREKVLGDLNAVLGAIQYCQQLIEKVELAEKAKKEAKVSDPLPVGKSGGPRPKEVASSKSN